MASRRRAAGPTWRETITIDDNEDEVVPTFTLDLTDDDELDGPDYLREVTLIEAHALAALVNGRHYLESVETLLGATVTPGMCVELTDGDFLRVKHIVKKENQTTRHRQIFLEGALIRRTRRVDDMLPKKYNEVAYILRASVSNGAQPMLDDCLVSRPLADATVVRDLICTNQPFPALSFRETDAYYDYARGDYDFNKVQELAILVCRWKYLEVLDSAGRKVLQQSLERLKEHECTLGSSIPDTQLAYMWRGGQHHVSPPPKDVVDLTGEANSSARYKKRKADVDLTRDDEYEEEIVETSSNLKSRRISRNGITERQESIVTKRRILTAKAPVSSSSRGAPSATNIHQYRLTYGDICAGAGGMTSGAQQAGLKPSWVLDQCPDAAASLRANFLGTKTVEKNIFDFCTGPHKVYYRVDVLHISFPCQPHSPAHTKDGKDDEANIATGYSVQPILERCRPRVVTFEQTSGMFTHGGGWHLRALIHQLSAAGYSTRWKIINMAEFGNVHARKRLIIIAAGPGEVLPDFPAPTYGIGRHLKPFTTIRDVLARVPEFIEPDMRQHTLKPHGIRYDPSQPLTRAITTDGGESNTHPDGWRSFNLRELAMLQGFPARHKFEGTMTSIKKQIGNAVPSCFSKTLFEEIIRSLRESDRRYPPWKPEVIELD